MTCSPRRSSQSLASQAFSRQFSYKSSSQRPSLPRPPQIEEEMKREGRQHGLVRSYMELSLPTSRSRKMVNQITSPATAGIFQRVSSKPTNHSKFTGKCGRARCNGCHDHPVSKSRDKAKGTQKLKSIDVLVNHRLLDWRLKGKLDGFKSVGNLDDSYGDHWGDSDDDMEGELEEVCVNPVAFSGMPWGDSDDDMKGELEKVCENPVTFSGMPWGDGNDDMKGELEEVCENPVAFSGMPDSIPGIVEEEEEVVGWGFVGFVVDSGDEEEDWCIVGEL